MLSKINRLVREFEKAHGFRPNLLYLNTNDLSLLQLQLSEDKLNILSQLIGMEIIIIKNGHIPYVSWAQIPWRHARIA